MKTDEKLLAEAERIYGSNEIEIDEDTKISRADDESGAWVRAWVWVEEG